MRSEERLLDGAEFERRKATADTRRKIKGWDVWECADATFSHDYDRAVTLFVHEGRATVTFAGGEKDELGGHQRIGRRHARLLPLERDDGVARRRASSGRSCSSPDARSVFSPSPTSSGASTASPPR